MTKYRLPDDDEPAPFVRIRRRRQLTEPVFTAAAGAAGACTGKKAFPSAHAVFKVLRKKTNIDGRRAYRCPICRQWHIGSSTRRDNKE